MDQRATESFRPVSDAEAVDHLLMTLRMIGRDCS